MKTLLLIFVFAPLLALAQSQLGKGKYLGIRVDDRLRIVKHYVIRNGEGLEPLPVSLPELEVVYPHLKDVADRSQLLLSELKRAHDVFSYLPSAVFFSKVDRENLAASLGKTLAKLLLLDTSYLTTVKLMGYEKLMDYYNHEVSGFISQIQNPWHNQMPQGFFAKIKFRQTEMNFKKILWANFDQEMKEVWPFDLIPERNRMLTVYGLLSKKYYGADLAKFSFCKPTIRRLF